MVMREVHTSSMSSLGRRSVRYVLAMFLAVSGLCAVARWCLGHSNDGGTMLMAFLGLSMFGLGVVLVPKKVGTHSTHGKSVVGWSLVTIGAMLAGLLFYLASQGGI